MIMLDLVTEYKTLQEHRKHAHNSNFRKLLRFDKSFSLLLFKMYNQLLFDMQPLNQHNSLV